MAVLYVTEFAQLVQLPGGRSGQIPMQPPLAQQTVSIGGTSAACTNPFQAGTRLVRLHTDAICSVAFGVTPTAAATGDRLAASQTEYRAVPPGASYKVAVITNS